ARFQRDVFDDARAVEGRARDGRVGVHVGACGVRGGLARLQDAARARAAATHAELRVFTDKLLFFIRGRLLRRAVPRPGLRRGRLRLVRLRLALRARAGQGVHRVQAVEG